MHKNGLPTLADLKPLFKWKSSDSANGADANRVLASQSDDFIKHVDTGVQTLLNTREYVYYSYYSRIKRQLRQYWEPSIKEKMRRILERGRTIASDPENRVTELIIILDSKGTLRKIRVVGASGIKDLDDAAIEAFKAAAPFPNPPAGIIEKDGTVKIRWDFVLEA